MYKKIIYLILVLITCVLFYVNSKRPINVIERSLKVDLPSNVSILEYNYYPDSESFDAKIKINDSDTSEIQKELCRFFGKESNRDLSEMPNFANVSNWWDLNNADIDKFYNRSTGSRRTLFKSLPKTHNVWTFITKKTGDHRFLYISY